MKKRIFILDDEKDMILMAKSLLETQGYSVESETQPEKGVAKLLATPPDLLLLDVQMPEMDGIEVCKALRADSRTKTLPIVIVSVQKEEADIVAGLEVGADDYVGKPYRKRELAARVKSILRRRHIETMPQILEEGPLRLQLDQFTAKVNGERLDLTPKEFQLLAYFLKREGHVLTRGVISENVWGVEHQSQMRTIDTHVAGLRRKLGENGRWIEKVHGIGYRFEIDSEISEAG